MSTSRRSGSRLKERVGLYRLERCLGEGGFAQVYAGRMDGDDRQFAIKIQDDSDPDSVRRFEREIALLRQLDHPAIPRLVDAGRDGNSLFLVTELHGARGLDELMQARSASGGFTIDEAMALLAGLADVLAYCHRAGVIHRDVKPANILVRDHLRPVLVDFGLGRHLDRTAITGMQDVLGTIKYMSPEHLEPSIETDGRADQYQLALVGYELLTGRHALPPIADPQQLLARFAAPIEAPSLRRDGVSPAADIALLRALSLSCEERFPDMESFREALLEGWRAPSAEVTARRPAPSGRSQLGRKETARPARPTGRRPITGLVAALTAGLACVLISSLGALRSGSRSSPAPGPAVTPARAGASPGLSAPGPRTDRSPAPFPVPPPRGRFTELVGRHRLRLEMEYVPGGEFLMGTMPNLPIEPLMCELPAHKVTVRPFHMAQFETTQALYREVMGSNPSFSKGDQLPADSMSWRDASEFCRKLSRLTGRGYRLPSEAEWEFACRAGNPGFYYWGNAVAPYDQYMWCHENAAGRSHPVGKKLANAYNLHDMLGNVWEWTLDIWHLCYFGDPVDGSARVEVGSPPPNLFNEPIPPADPGKHMTRGGGWDVTRSVHCRSAVRGSPLVLQTASDLGFRVACDDVRLAR